MWTWLNDNGGALSVVLVVIPLVWAAVEYIRKARDERRNERFVNYHKLIEGLVDGEPGRPLRADRQLAIVFELQKYREYRRPSTKILHGFKEIALAQPKINDRLVEQIDETLLYLR